MWPSKVSRNEFESGVLAQSRRHSISQTKLLSDYVKFLSVLILLLKHLVWFITDKFLGLRGIYVLVCCRKHFWQAVAYLVYFYWQLSLNQRSSVFSKIKINLTRFPKNVKAMERTLDANYVQSGHLFYWVQCISLLYVSNQIYCCQLTWMQSSSRHPKL